MIDESFRLRNDDSAYSLTIILLIDLVLIDQESVGKRSLHLMDTVIAKKRWTTIYRRVNKFLKKCYTLS
jgi:hypothetical protein